MNKLIAFASLALACLFVACSQPSTSPQGAPDAASDGPHPYMIDASAIVGVTAEPLVRKFRRAVAPAPSAIEPETRTPQQLAVAACETPDGQWRCRGIRRPLASNASQPIIPASWTVSTWAIDPSNSTGCASDSNSGTSTTCGAAGVGPLLTANELIVHRWGCFGAPQQCPIIQQATTVNVLSSQPSTYTDVIMLSPGFAEASPISVNMTWQGAPKQLATATIGTFTARNRTSGTKNTITASGQSGSFWTPYVEDLVHDTTANAWFWIEHDNGTATAAITEPLAASSSAAAATYVTITNGDALVIYSLPAIRVGMFKTYSTNAQYLISNYLNFTGSGGFDLTEIDGFISINQTHFDQYVRSEGNSFWCVNCYFGSSGTYYLSTVAFGGAVTGSFPSFGTDPTHGETELDGDILVDASTPHTSGLTEIGRAYFSAGIDTVASIGSALYIGPVNYADGEQWGPCSLDAQAGFQVFVNGPSTAMLCTGGYQIDGVSTAWPWSGGTNAFGAAVSVTPANIASNGGLIDPKTGSRIFVGAL